MMASYPIVIATSASLMASRVDPALQPATSCARLPTTSAVCAITLSRSSDDIA